MKILGIDLATKTGWCLLTANGAEGTDSVGGTWNMTKKANDNHCSLVTKFYSCLNSLSEHHKIDFVGWERVDFAKFVMAHAIHNQLLGVLKLWCATHSIPLEPVPVGTLKKFATKSGKASKEEMLHAAMLRWPGVEFVDDNEVDARWIAEWFLAQKQNNPTFGNMSKKSRAKKPKED
jgi:Holliday junction resolvasome RuvABC endonuclease subunit